jgi:hypothetical protein
MNFFRKASIANEFWFGDGVPVIGKQFTAEKARGRKDTVVDLLYRTAKRERRAGDAGVADRLEILADKIFSCHQGRRCGSLACTECLRAFQKAKVAAQRTTIKLLKATRNSKLLPKLKLGRLRLWKEVKAKLR